MPVWQENRPFLLRVGAGAAVTLVIFAIAMSLYGTASTTAEENDDEIDLISDAIGDLEEEANALGWQEALRRRLGDLEGQVLYRPRPAFDYTDVSDDDRGTRFKDQMFDLGRDWRDAFRKRNMEVDDSVRQMGLPSDAAGSDEDILRLDIVDRIFEAIDLTGLAAVRSVQHGSPEVLSLRPPEADDEEDGEGLPPPSGHALVRYPIVVVVEGPYAEVAKLVRLLQDSTKYVHLRQCTLQSSGDGGVEASLDLGAVERLSQAEIEERQIGGRKTGRAPGRFRRGR